MQTLTVEELRERLAELTQTVSHIAVESPGFKMWRTFDATRTTSGDVRFGAGPNDELAFESTLAALRDSGGILTCHSETGARADGTVLQDARAWLWMDGEGCPMPRNMLAFQLTTDRVSGETLAPKDGVTFCADTDDEPDYDFSSYDGGGPPATWSDAHGAERFDVRVSASDEDIAALSQDEREYFDDISQVREALPAHTALGRALDAALGYHLATLAKLDNAVWGDDEDDDRRLFSAHAERLDADELHLPYAPAYTPAPIPQVPLEAVCAEAFARTAASEAAQFEALALHLLDAQDSQAEFACVHLDELREPDEKALRRAPALAARLASSHCFVDFEDEHGQPSLIQVSDLTLAVHGAFIALRSGGEMLTVTPLITVLPGDARWIQVRRPFGAVSYGEGPPFTDYELTDLERYVDCAELDEYGFLSEDIDARTWFGLNARISQDICNAIMTALVEHLAPARARGQGKRAGGKRGRRR